MTMIQYITSSGELTKSGENVWNSYSQTTKRKLLHWLIQLRSYDRQCMIWSKQGKVLNYPPFSGQEAVQAGSVLALDTDDWLFPTYRDYGACLVHGVPIEHSLLYWQGRIEANQTGQKWRVLPLTISIATHLLHAVGTAWAAKYQEKQTVSLVLFGDGATSEGDFHEACNLAGLMKLPVIFMCQNNGYAISTPFQKQSASDTVAEKAGSYGFPGCRIDGNDVLAVYEITQQAIRRARQGEGPTLIEAITYRQQPHTMSDDPRKYRSIEEETEWKARDPLHRYLQLLLTERLITPHEIQIEEEACQKRLLQAMEQVKSMVVPNEDHLFAHVFYELPSQLERQRSEVAKGENAIATS